MKDNTLLTEFAPAERSSKDELDRQSATVSQADIQQTIIDHVPDFIFVLNANRQIVYTNKSVSLLNTFGSEKDIIGLRPGELLDCIHARKNEGGCGTTKFCKECGAVNAILSSLRGKEDVQECRIIQKSTGSAVDLRVWTAPITINGETYSIFIATDIDNEKRKSVLERIFLHDITNTMTSILASAELLEDVTPYRVKEIGQKIRRSGMQLVDQIDAHRELIAAEANELTVHAITIESTPLLQEIINLYKDASIAKDRQILMDKNIENIRFSSDRVIITRVLGNMLKNALEATDSGETVTIGANRINDDIRFTVHNHGFIPNDVQLQIFHRSFSTKGFGRGLGTYSVKLLSERYLKGAVTFTSTENEGTTFIAQYPLVLS